jgi:hypothetical protein
MSVTQGKDFLSPVAKILVAAGISIVLLLVFINSRDLSTVREPDASPVKVLQLSFEDRPDGSIAVIDYKTGKSAKYADTGQLELMALGLFKHFPVITSIKAGLLFVACNAFIKDKYDISMEPKLWQKWLRHYTRVEAAYATDVWNPNPSGLCRRHCSVLSCSHNGRS